MSSAFICSLAFYVPQLSMFLRILLSYVWRGWDFLCTAGRHRLWLVNLINFKAVELKFQSETRLKQLHCVQ